jgi:hypothetical protein
MSDQSVATILQIPGETIGAVIASEMTKAVTGREDLVKSIVENFLFAQIEDPSDRYSSKKTTRVELVLRAELTAILKEEMIKWLEGQRGAIKETLHKRIRSKAQIGALVDAMIGTVTSAANDRYRMDIKILPYST